jgi:hypothetical protein
MLSRIDYCLPAQLLLHLTCAIRAALIVKLKHLLSMLYLNTQTLTQCSRKWALEDGERLRNEASVAASKHRLKRATELLEAAHKCFAWAQVLLLPLYTIHTINTMTS